MCTRISALFYTVLVRCIPALLLPPSPCRPTFFVAVVNNSLQSTLAATAAAAVVLNSLPKVWSFAQARIQVNKSWQTQQQRKTRYRSYRQYCAYLHFPFSVFYNKDFKTTCHTSIRSLSLQHWQQLFNIYASLILSLFLSLLYRHAAWWGFLCSQLTGNGKSCRLLAL